MPRLPLRSLRFAALSLTLLGLGVAATAPLRAASAPAATPAATAPPATPRPADPAPLPTPASRTVALRWSVPEPRLVGGAVERPLLHRELPLTLTATQVAQVRAAGTLEPIRAELGRVYAAVEGRTPRDLRFVRRGGRWVGEARTGWTVDRAASGAALLAALRGDAAASPLTVTLQAPARSVRWAAQEKLQHLGSGESGFAGSPDFRVHNIRVGAARVHGAWVAAGRGFSFNALIGPISAATGFRPGYVVTGNTLSTEDGGGLCQVSTTVFRAAFRAGLPITERHAHSYQVAYYGDPGLDAAVYAPAKDLRWRNDTGGPVLVQAAWDVKKEALTVSLFGRADGRTVSIGKAVVTRRRPAPEPSFVVDRELEAGGARRIDMPAAGLRAAVTRTVTVPGGPTRRDTVTSTYRAWGGVFAVAPGDERLR
ncbi:MULTISPECIES: VanW family protein [Deinococcus]|uniref:VanW family protein n=1 Tax=Deinococcus rufus TaxID=2136097 RepID=A0ABV7Z5J4_9DEIO|nr:VanW family protein [Deinococcus sp. AB2017081]WQE95178.1 VanW family protein [Deinococcus sp. AB2017081]